MSRYSRRLLDHLGRDAGVGLGERRVDRVLDELALQRVLAVVDDLDRRPLAAAEAERALELLGRRRRDDERAERLAGSRPSRSPPRASSTRIGSTFVEQLVRVLGGVDAAGRRASTVDSSAGHEVGERDAAACSGPRESAKPDQQRDDDRVDDEHADEQRRAPEDLQVLEQQPAHALSGPSRAGSARTPPRSRALAAAPADGSARARVGLPENSSSPSASTSTRSA